jgi:hypothetical protein
MKDEGIFSRLVELIQGEDVNNNGALHRMLLSLLYEMSRIQRLSWDDLGKPLLPDGIGDRH